MTLAAAKGFCGQVQNGCGSAQRDFIVEGGRERKGKEGKGSIEWLGLEGALKTT